MTESIPSESRPSVTKPEFLNDPEVAFAIEAAAAAGILSGKMQGELAAESIAKDDRSPVTAADFAVQALIARRLGEAFPGAVLVGEEAAGVLRGADHAAVLDDVVRYVRQEVADADSDSVCDWIDAGRGDPGGRFWTVDPIDGTKGFLRGDQFAVALALIESGAVRIAVLGCPRAPCDGATGALYAAVAGGGAWVRGLAGGDWKRISTSAAADPKQARLLRSAEKAHTNIDRISLFAERLGAEADAIGMDSQAKYGVLASGGGEVMLRLLSSKAPDYREKIWDQAAGSLLLVEAGGRVTDLDGAELDFSRGTTLAANRGVLATNGPLHEAALAALRAMGE